MSTLIVTLPLLPFSASTPCESVLVDDGATVARQVEAPVALLPSAPGAEVVAVVPVQSLSWHRLTLPRGTLDHGYFSEGSAPRLRSVLEGLLEDRLLDDPSHLHFALEPKAQDSAPVWVAVCDRAWLQAWIAALEQAGRPVARIVPEMAPHSSGAPAGADLQIMGTPEQAQLVHNGPDGLTLLPLSSAAVALVTRPDAQDAPDAVVAVVAEPGVAVLAEQFFKRSVALQTRTERAVAAAQSSWDLAQFDLLRTRGTRTRKHLSAMVTTLLHAPQWRAARWCAIALVAVNLVGVQAWAWKEQSAQAAKRTAIRDTLMTTFPDVRVVVDAPLQMARALADLQRQSGAASSADLETLLGEFQAAAPGTPAPAAIDFIAGELQLKGLDPAFASLTDIASRLQTQGYAARWEADSLVMKQERRP